MSEARSSDVAEEDAEKAVGELGPEEEENVQEHPIRQWTPEEVSIVLPRIIRFMRHLRRRMIVKRQQLARQKSLQDAGLLLVSFSVPENEEATDPTRHPHQVESKSIYGKDAASFHLGSDQVNPLAAINKWQMQSYYARKVTAEKIAHFLKRKNEVMRTRRAWEVLKTTIIQGERDEHFDRQSILLEERNHSEEIGRALIRLREEETMLQLQHREKEDREFMVYVEKLSLERQLERQHLLLTPFQHYTTKLQAFQRVVFENQVLQQKTSIFLDASMELFPFLFSHLFSSFLVEKQFLLEKSCEMVYLVLFAGKILLDGHPAVINGRFVTPRSVANVTLQQQFDRRVHEIEAQEFRARDRLQLDVDSWWSNLNEEHLESILILRIREMETRSSKYHNERFMKYEAVRDTRRPKPVNCGQSVLSVSRMSSSQYRPSPPCSLQQQRTFRSFTSSASPSHPGSLSERNRLWTSGACKDGYRLGLSQNYLAAVSAANARGIQALGDRFEANIPVLHRYR